MSPCKAFLVDLPDGATKGMRTEHDGWDGASAEIVNNQATYGDRAGITATDYNRFVAYNDQIAQIQVQLPRVSKAREVLGESVAHIDNQRHKLATQFANSPNPTPTRRAATRRCARPTRRRSPIDRSSPTRQ